jgi:hypothetical protein
MKRVLFTLAMSWFTLSLFAQSVQGFIVTDTLGIEVLKVWGTHAQRGYAQGYLTGNRITDLIKNYIKPSFGPYYSVAKGIITTGVDIQMPPDYAIEAQSVVDGMNAAGSNPENFDQTDILLANSFLDVSNLLAKKLQGNGCSTLMSWGDATLGTDLDGKAICSRHMDWTVSPVLYNNNTIIVHFPSEVGERPWLLIGYAGMLSALSGVNQDVAVFQQMMSDVNIPGQHNQLYEPIWMTLRKALEMIDYNNDGAYDVQDVRSALVDRTTGFADAYIITTMGKNNPEDTLVAMVAEIAPTSPTHTYRYIDFPDSIPGDNLYAANNRIKRNNAMNFCSRYNGIRNNIGDGTLIGTDRNWELLRDFSHQSSNMQFMQYGPESDLLRISVFRDGRPAYMNDPVIFSLNDLFATPVMGMPKQPLVNTVISPVPAHDKLLIQHIAKGRYSVDVLSMDGRVLQQLEASLPGQIQLNALPDGVYCVSLSGGATKFASKFIIKR